MRIYTRGCDLAFKTFTFPDGQPHFVLETYEREFDTVTVETAIKTCADLFMVALVSSVLRSCGYTSVQLDIRYLLGARMDRSISWAEPFTLDLVARFVNGCGFSRVRLLDVHSAVAIKLIRNSFNVLPVRQLAQVLDAIGECDVIIPDKGAHDRVFSMCRTGIVKVCILQCYKDRDPSTGKILSFRVPSEGLKDRTLLIVDDICDGGATFTGLSKELRAKGAKAVNLFVTHGIFSKDIPLEGIDRIFTTNSVIDPFFSTRGVTVMPVSMKEM